MIHVMAAARLGRAAMAPPVMGDDPEALAEKEEHLSVPIVRRERPAMAEHDGLTRTPVLVENIGAVPGGDRGHVLDPFRGVGSRASLEEGGPCGPECGTAKIGSIAVEAALRAIGAANVPGRGPGFFPRLPIEKWVSCTPNTRAERSQVASTRRRRPPPAAGHCEKGGPDASYATTVSEVPAR